MNAISTFDNDFTAITLVIPAYKPAENLINIVKTLLEYPFRKIVVVDDGSGDTFQSIFNHLKQMANVTLLQHQSNQGKGAALKTAFRHIVKDSEEDTSHILTLDADGQHSPNDIVALAKRTTIDGDKLILGVRTFPEDIPLRSRFGNLLTRKVLSWTSRLRLQDTQTGLRCMPVGLAEKTLSIKSDCYEFELECLLLTKQTNTPILQQPIETIYLDDNASSHFRPLIDSIRIYLVFARYLLVSLYSFILDISIFAVLHYLTGNIIGSTYAARVVSGSFNFYYNKHSVFRSHNKQGYLREALGYIALAIIVATLSGIFVNQLFQLTHWHPAIVKIIVDGSLFFLSFIVQRMLIFPQISQNQSV